MSSYDPKIIEKKWQEKWEKDGLYQVDDKSDKPKYYCLDMFPYPSGSGLHVGHWRGFVLSDIVARYQKLRGKNVMHPMGYDAFGLPAENAAIAANSHPKKFTDEAIENFRRQLKQIGTMIDWSREINTSKPEYYRWTQWIFLQLYKNGLAYRKEAPVNWCPSCQTVLANEQVVNGECERCGSRVVKKDLTQWFFRITDFAEDLLNDLDGLDWPERTKTLQRNWIGRSEGALIKFKVKDLDEEIEVFTTRADTLFGATFMVLAPEHPAIEKLKAKSSKLKEIDDYIQAAKNKSEIDREAINKEKTGVFTGAYAINPINNNEMPIWIADYCLMGYGTGAVMCVPAHDERDFEFAKKFGLVITQVISHDKKESELARAYVEPGVLINSGPYDGMQNRVAAEKIIADLASKKQAKKSTTYRLRDWLISRQRYWGAPIPIVYCEKHGEVAVSEKDLPVKLPEDVEFQPKGDSPLKSSESFLKTTCPKCDGPAKRETDTMDTFVDSSWYYLRYCDHDDSQNFADEKKINYWMPVDTYVGGVEHAILHLLYARFISKALSKLKILNFNENGEPFKKLFNIGMIYLHGAKMSKSKGNVVSPDDLIEKYGTDALRGYELFIGPAEQDSEWQVHGIAGVRRFLDKVWQVLGQNLVDSDENDLEIEETIATVTNEIESLHPNTAISHLMTLFNYLKDQKNLSRKNGEKICLILAPFFPHLAEEIWEKMGHRESVFCSSWPKFSEIRQKKVSIPVQINGKVKDVINIDKALSQSAAQKIAEESEKVKPALFNKKVKKVIYVAGRIINFVVE